MKELEFINIIKNKLNNTYLGDDCAYLKDFGIVITQDSLVEDIHFKRRWYTPKQLGYKSVAVNISDILASGAKPAYVTIALSLPENIDNNFISEFYDGAKEALFGAEIVGGDITGSSNKIFISITAIGTDKNRKISSRKNAKIGYSVITKGQHGLSNLGLKELLNNGKNKDLISAHLEPKLEENFSRSISTKIKDEYAMMDTSDGLADALFKIAVASNVKIKTKFIDGMFGAEDYKLVAVIPNEFLKELNEYDLIGTVEEYDGSFLQIDNKKYINYDDLKLFDHFGGIND